MTSLLGVPVDAAYHLVSGFTGFLTPALGGLAAVAAIIVFTIAVRALLMPLSLRALRGQAAMARLAPQLQALRQRYAKQPERLQREMTALYKREGTSMFAGLMPLLLQWPLLSVMYLLFRSAAGRREAERAAQPRPARRAAGRHWLAGRGPASAARPGLRRPLRPAGRPVLAVGPAGQADDPCRWLAADARLGPAGAGAAGRARRAARPDPALR